MKSSGLPSFLFLVNLMNNLPWTELTSLGLSLVTDVGVLVAHADHDTGVFGPANDRGEDGARSVITGEAGLAHA